MKGSTVPRARRCLAACVLMVAVCSACNKAAPVVDDVTRLSGRIARAIGIGRQEAKPIARGLISEYGSEADDVFKRYGVPLADDVDQTLAGLVAKAEERREQSGIISSIACDAVTRYVDSGEVPSGESLSEAMVEAVRDEYQGQAAAAATHVVEIVQAFEGGEVNEAQLGFTQLIYCDFVAG